ncbi:DNA alkylation repair protein [Salsipaludibacter albus]|uniref:DNA alkylation repair protein n=1 Tax=Salsipaludibacter albus TaxID=2849650 RepID=UPI001EE3F4BA|nr:DNA alkylation repair protein [Salsipaludibacter albus]MBY5162068.1 DNA alkylation repair protein [Salsipaludibacter albus]
MSSRTSQADHHAGDTAVAREVVSAVRSGLADHADPERAAGQQRYMKSTMPFHGVTMGEMRRIVGPIVRDPAHELTDRDQWEVAVLRLWDDATHREERYAAIELALARRYHRWHDLDVLPLAAHLVTTGAWWDLVDATAKLVGEVLATHPEEVAPTIRDWARADDLWLRRVAIISQLGAKADTDLDLLTDVIDANLEGSTFGDEFFVRKAIGWALRQYARVDPDWVRTFVADREDRLSGLSRREARKHL